ncbi:MAG: putative lipid II flippase FtsW, partial [Chloroflexi bacterium]|nr:putative lipid II flippase FtsW [Chloroflexota bacterium]
IEPNEVADSRPLAVDRPRTSSRGRVRAARPGDEQPAALAVAYSGERHAPDWMILVLVVALSGVGILMVFSSTAVTSYAAGDGFLGVVGPQAAWAAIGFALLLLLMNLDYRWLRLASLPLLALALGLLVLVLVPQFRVEVGGSGQWLKLPGLPAVQPGELAKLAMVIYLAHWMARRGTAIRGLRGGLLPFLVIVVPVVFLIFKGPDIGTSGILALTAVVMFFIAGGNPLYLAGLAAPVVLVGLAVMKDYQLDRLRAFVDPFADPTGIGFHSVQGLLALGLGGLVGAGLGETAAVGGVILPNAYNDYVFAIVGQEFGFVGAGAVIVAFLLLAWRGVRVALAAPDTFGALLAAGVTALLCFQALVNIGVVVTLLPVTGITLPFVSAGGSSLIVSLAAVGILLSVSRETLPRGGVVDASPDRGRRNRRAHLPGPGRRPLAPRPARPA